MCVWVCVAAAWLKGVQPRICLDYKDTINKWFNKWFTNSTSIVNHSHAPWICANQSPQTTRLKKQATLSGNIWEKHNNTWTEHWYAREKQKIVQELKGKLQLQQNLFTKATAKVMQEWKLALLWLKKSPKVLFGGRIFEAVHAERYVSRCAPTRYRLTAVSVCQETPSQIELRNWQTIWQHSWPKSHAVTWLFH